MHSHTANQSAVGGALIAFAIIVAAVVWTHGKSTAEIYGRLLGNTAATTDLVAPTDAVMAIAREGVRWAHGLHFESIVAVVVLFVILFAFVGFHLWFIRI